MDKFLIGIANDIENLIVIANSESVRDELDGILDKVLNKIESPWRYDPQTDSYILCSSEEWERREAEEMALQKPSKML